MALARVTASFTQSRTAASARHARSSTSPAVCGSPNRSPTTSSSPRCGSSPRTWPCCATRSTECSAHSARGGAGPLLETLEAYFDEALSTTAAARRLHLSVRAVSYRLERIATLTGRSLRDPLDRFILETAVRGRHLLDPALVAGGGADG